MSLLQYQENTIRGLQYEAEYSDYWNSTASDDGRLNYLQSFNTFS
jgi:amidase